VSILKKLLKHYVCFIIFVSGRHELRPSAGQTLKALTTQQFAIAIITSI